MAYDCGTYDMAAGFDAECITVFMPPGRRLTAAVLKKIIEQCGFCNPCGGSGSGSTAPCGNAGCLCCPGSRWFSTAWYNAWTTTSPKWATGAISPTYTMTNYSMSVVPQSDPLFYLGDDGLSDPTQCEIAGMFRVDEHCVPGSPIHILTGTVTWTQVAAPHLAFTYNVDYFGDIVLFWDCAGVASQAATFNGLYLNGLLYVAGTDPLFDSFGGTPTADFAIAVNGNTDQTNSGEGCTWTMDLNTGLHIPNISVAPVY